MIRTTISKIKRVCTIAFVPRLLRGNLRYTPSIYATFGKFEKFTSSVKSARKSTKASGDDDELQPSGKQPKAGISIVSLSRPVDLTNHNHDIETTSSFTKVDIPSNVSTSDTSPQCNSTKKSNYDKCSKVISEIFGEDNTPMAPQEDMLMMTYATISNDPSRGKVITDKNTQINIFGKYDSRSFRTTSHIKTKRISNDDDSGKSKDNFQSVLCYDAVVMKEKDGKQAKDTNSKPVEGKLEDSQLKQANDITSNACLYDVDPEDIPQCKIDTKALKLASKENLASGEMDAYWTDVYERTIEKNFACYEPNQAIDLETLNVYRALKGDTQAEHAFMESRRIIHTPEEVDRMLRGYPYHEGFYDSLFNSTPDKQNEEKLAQRIEHIDETPLVEAGKTRMGDFNTGPKILGNLDKSTTSKKSNLDEMAHRCLNLPQTQVDQVLLKEMEKLGVPVSGLKTSDEAEITNPLRSDISQAYLTKPLDYNNLAKFKPSNEFPNNLTGVGGIKFITPSSLQAEEQNRNSLKGLTASEVPKESKEAIQSTITPDFCYKELKNTKFNADNVKQISSRVNTLDEEQEEPAFKQLDKLGTSQTLGLMSDKPIFKLSDDETNLTNDLNLTENSNLNPNHILTCNETCPLAPEAFINDKDQKDLEGTEVMFERSVLADSIPTESEADDKAQKLRFLNDGGCGSYAIREITRARYTFSNANAKDAMTLDAYIKMIQSANSEIADGRPMTLEDRTKELTNTSTMEPKSEYTISVETPKESKLSAQLPGMGSTPELPLVGSINYAKEIATESSAEAREFDSARASSVKPLESVSQSAERRERTTRPTELQIDSKPYTMYKHLRDKPSKIKDVCDIDLIGSIQATNEKLQATSEQLQATSEQLQATSERLEVATGQLQSTSEKLDDTCEKLNLSYTNRTDEKYKTESLVSTVDDSLKNENDQEHSFYDPTIKPLIKPATEDSTKTAETPIITSALQSKGMDISRETDKSSKTKGSPNPTLTSYTLPVTDRTPTLKPLPDVKDDIKLSELMKLVKERNRLEAQQLATKPAEAKQSIPPMQQPRHNTPVFKTPGYPKLKPKPKVCAPRKKPSPKKSNCTMCDLKTLGIDHDLRNETPDYNELYLQDADSIAITNNVLPSANITDEILLHLKNMGYILDSVYQKGKVCLESAVLAKTQQQFKAKDFEPWTPIPSWPFSKKYKRPKLQCPKDGCPEPPPRLIHDPPCGLKPCKTFPTYPKRTFSVLNYCTVILSDPQVVEIGEF